MSIIGVEPNPDTLVLWRGRDFKWSFVNVDASGAPIDFEPGDLYFELDTGGEHNAVQEVSVLGASGGTYKLGVNGTLTGPIDYYDATSNPHGMDGDVTDALEAIPTVGAGNVFVHPASLYPAWKISLELNASKNEVQEVKVTGNPVPGAEFKLAYGNAISAVIAFDDDGDGADPDAIKTALEAIGSIGSGNVDVTQVDKYTYRVEFVGALAGTNVDQLAAHPRGIGWGIGLLANVRTSTITNGLAKLTEPLMNLINQTVNDVFDSFDTLLGVDLDFVVTDELNAALTATSLRAFNEVGIITFSVDATANMIENAITNIADLADLLDTITVDFYWNHIYRVEFIGDLGNTAIPKMTVNTASLTGATGDQTVEVSVVEPGKSRMTLWNFDIDGSGAEIKVESTEADLVAPRISWQLVFLPDGESSGGDPITTGTVRVVGE